MRRLLYHPALLPFAAPGSRCPASLTGSHAQFDSARRFSLPGDLPSSTRSRDFGGSPERPCLARGDSCPPGKGCNRAGPSSRDEARVLQPLLHCTQERWWPLTNPGSASLEPVFLQAPVQDADAQAHDQIHSAPGLACSNQPEGRLLSCFDSSMTQTVPMVCIRGSGMAVQGPQLPRRLAHPGPIQRAVVQSQGLGASAPQPVGASSQLGKEQALPCAENLFSRLAHSASLADSCRAAGRATSITFARFYFIELVSSRVLSNR